MKGFRTLPGRILVGLVSAAVLIPLFLNACSSSSLPSNRTLTTIPSITAPAISSGAVPAVSPVKTTPVSASSQDKSVHVWASPERQEIHTGEKFAVNIWIKTSIAVRGVQWRLTFDPQKLRCDSAQEGDFLKNWAVQHEGSTLVFPQPETDNQNGFVPNTGIVVLAQADGGASGAGVLFTYSFIALTEPIARVVVSDVIAADQNGNSAEVSLNTP